MAEKNDKTSAEPKKKSAPRKIRTEQERIADLEAQLEKVRNAGRAKDEKAKAKLVDQDTKLTERIDKLVAQRDGVREELAAVNVRLEQPSAE